jgi:flagellar hook-basal body complex protein FliE
VQKADIAFHLMMQVRNKLVQAFEDVEKISI